MQIIDRCEALSELLNMVRNDGKKVHFIPTMGALHEGHVSLLTNALDSNAITVVSVFVNPSQFNKSKDLHNYPRTFEADKKKLKDAGCHIMFFPSVKEVYPDSQIPNFDLEGLDTLMEGEFRPGHFQGVVQVVDRLFSIIQPDKAFFGQKDFQQLAVVQHMMKKLGHQTEVLGCPTIREASGLAMSSRNMLLSDEALTNASIIYTTLENIKDGYKKGSTIDVLINQAKSDINSIIGFELEYLEIVNPGSLDRINENQNKTAVACVAAYVEGVRLIDNLMLIA
ncbi:MAG: pantoate--beta-alanine ligase [Bacteroidia bacterium]|jgi:pantoate--beta-alanine ligase